MGEFNIIENIRIEMMNVMLKKIVKSKTVFGLAILLFIVASIFALILAGIQTLLDLWRSVPSDEWLLTFFIIPLVSGVCAIVCYLFCSLFNETDSSSDRHWLS